MTIFRRDPGLLVRFREGDRDALCQVYQGYQPKVQYLATRLVRRCPILCGADESADLVQDTFERAFSDRARVAYDGIRSYSDYLCAITHHRFVDRVRRARHELKLSSTRDYGLLFELAHESAPNPDTSKLLRTTLKRLPHSVRLVCWERLVLETSQHDTAGKLGLTRAKVRRLEQEAKRELRRAMFDHY